MPIGSIIGGLIGKGGSDQAAQVYEQAARQADFIRHQNQAQLSPWFQSGQDANNVISGLLGLGHYVSDGQGYGGLKLDARNWQGDQQNAFSKFQASPDYNFRLNEGIRSLDRSAASKGMLLSGAQTKGVQQYGSGLASGEYGNWFNRLNGVAGTGLAAAQSENNSNLSATQLQNQALAGQASAYQSSANALASGIGGAFNSLGSILGMAGGFGGLGNIFGGGGGGMGAAGTPGSAYYGPVYSGI